MSEYSQKLRDPRWQKKRLEIMGRDQFRCRLCDDEENTLHVHHLKYEKGADPWDYPDTCLVTLCEGCHEELHVVKFGESLIEALIAGGATLDHLHGFLCAIQGEFVDGPRAGALPRDRWDHALLSISYALMAVRRGATEQHIHEALHGLPK